MAHVQPRLWFVYVIAICYVYVMFVLYLYMFLRLTDPR
jgi:hypothetical protein